MKIILIDETEKKAELGKNYFILNGLIVDADQFINLNNKLDNILTNFGLKSFKDSRQIGLSKKDKIEITTQISNTLKEYNCCITSAFIGEFTLSTITNVEDKYFEALYFLLERFFLHLRKHSDTGIAIFDSLDKRLENKIKDAFFNKVNNEDFIWYLYRKSLGKYKQRIYPCPFFAKDEHSLVLQCSDLIASSLNSAIERSFDNGLVVEKLPEFNDYLNIYWSLFLKDPISSSVEGWGLKIWQ